MNGSRCVKVTRALYIHSRPPEVLPALLCFCKPPTADPATARAGRSGRGPGWTTSVLEIHPAVVFPFSTVFRDWLGECERFDRTARPGRRRRMNGHTPDRTRTRGAAPEMGRRTPPGSPSHEMRARRLPAGLSLGRPSRVLKRVVLLAALAGVAALTAPGRLAWPGAGGAGAAGGGRLEVPAWGGAVWVFAGTGPAEAPHAEEAGGPAAGTLHLWHDAVLAAGARSGIWGADAQRFGDDYRVRPVPAWPPPGLQPGDAVLLSAARAGLPPDAMRDDFEVMPKGHPVRDLLPKGIRAYALATDAEGHASRRDALAGWATPLAASRALAAALRVLAAAPPRPMLTAAVTAADMCWDEGLDCSPALQAEDTNVSCAEKRPLVLVDDDTPELPEAVLDRLRDLRAPRTQVIRLGHADAESVSTRLCLMAMAAVYVESGAEGHERGALEAAMFGAVPVVPLEGPFASYDGSSGPAAGEAHSAVPDEFRARFWKDRPRSRKHSHAVPNDEGAEEARLRALDADALVHAVDIALNAQAQGRWPRNNTAAVYARSLAGAWPAATAAWVWSLGLHVVLVAPGASTPPGAAIAASAALAWLVAHPLATVHLLVPDVFAFRCTPASGHLDDALLLGSSVTLSRLAGPAADAADDRTSLPWPGRSAMPPNTLVLWPPLGMHPSSVSWAPQLAARLARSPASDLHSHDGRLVGRGRYGRRDLSACAGKGAQLRALLVAGGASGGPLAHPVASFASVVEEGNATAVRLVADGGGVLRSSGRSVPVADLGAGQAEGFFFRGGGKCGVRGLGAEERRTVEGWIRGLSRGHKVLVGDVLGEE
ncbi:hypothetical protein DFJ74DRAFT_764820 [Hyaloraphidium curvatum]|nr:hypothetical protein DFJ74DRAFT_764820 [Hyaloraphidium curvatum]